MCGSSPMAEFRTASGVINTTPYLRTASGLVEVGATFFGVSGPIDGGGGQQPAIVAAASPSIAYGTGRVPTIITGLTTVTPSGGAAPYSYAWSLIDTAYGTWTATQPAAATTAFKIVGALEDEPSNATFSCLVTDANGKTATVTVEAQAYRYGASNGEF